MSRVLTSCMPLLLWLSFWCQVTAAAAVPRLTPRVDLGPILTQHAHEWSNATTVSFPGSEEFSNATVRWTTFDAPSYTAAISPADEQDLTRIVKLVTSQNIPFLATGGRHSYTTTIGALHDGLAIDLSRLDSISVDPTAGTLTVGAGVRVGSIIDPLYNAGFDLQTGSAPCPSLVGVTIGGGVGRYQGAYGLVIDALVSVRMVTAEGNVVEASKDSNPELFWGIRGAGANFGIITSATYKAHPLTDDGDVFVGEFIVPAGREAEYFELLERISPLEAKASSFMMFNYNSTTNRTQAQVQWVYKGHQDAAFKALAPVLDFGLEVTLVEMRKWNKLVSSIFGTSMETICRDNIPRNLYSWNLKNYSASSYDESFTKMDDFFTNYPGGRSSVFQFEFFPNQAMAAVPLDETAFSWRDTTGYINFNILFKEGDNVTDTASTALGLELRDINVATSGYSDLTVFVNYAHGDETLEQIYGEEKLPRLAALKSTWDPNKVFSWNNGLPTKYP